jgi:hypothetical protein
MSTKKQIAELKMQLNAFKKQCKTCKTWGCGHCAEPKFLLLEKIKRLESGGTV